MLFGRSIFQTVLTRLEEEGAEDEPPEASPAFRVTGLNASFVAATSEASPAASSSVAEAYLEAFAEPSRHDAPPETVTDPDVPAAMPAHLLRLSEGEIAEDLAITAADTAETLAEKRRHFARNNHPDRIAAAFRDNATQRMKIANLLIDQAIRELYWRSS
ncbi:MAG TPA: hypothetical protein VFY63_04485 [Pseudorhizobium sp.]|nr:hypothetical protein [Pseudorhizobium sp.]